ncbi:TraE/TraK family type IV conjugative transfer system protein [Rhodoferax antarcticus]|uniref:TraE/TraK family type IV conjugative transfer system protein n=1 Tax=Rhodoferax antarcticus TaxID=81479 RepID=UPI00095026BD|nr:TraE/TraK family type IV conjugative transfer system protein [Rhodoferax antarcticus]
MNLNAHSNNIVSLKRSNSLLAVACVVMALTIAMMAISSSSKHERIVIVPPGLSGSVEVDWGGASAEYIKSFGIFYATLVGTISPKNVTYVADRLSSMTTVNSYSVIRKRLLSLALDPQFVNSGSSVNFVSSEVVYEPERKKVFVIGESRVQSGYGEVKITPIVYEMDIEILEGRPVVMLLDNYVGTAPRTAKWILEHPPVKKDSQ